MDSPSENELVVRYALKPYRKGAVVTASCPSGCGQAPRSVALSAQSSTACPRRPWATLSAGASSTPILAQNLTAAVREPLLNLVHALKSFVYADIRLLPRAGPRGATLEVRVEPRKNGRGRCFGCNRLGPTYDHQPERRFDFVPCWGLLVFLLYTPRRVECSRCGIHVEAMPWAMGKSSMTTVYMSFLATWARRLSWTETARVFASTWDNVRQAVEWVEPEDRTRIHPQGGLQPLLDLRLAHLGGEVPRQMVRHGYAQRHRAD